MSSPVAAAVSDRPGTEADTRCRHCGLGAARGEAYCCLGCEMAARIAADGRTQHGHLRATLLISVLLTMAVMMLALFLYAEDIYGTDASAALGWMRSGYRWASLALASPVMLLCGLPLLRRGLRRLRRMELSMELLVATGAAAAYAVSLLSLATGGTHIYLDSATAAVVLATFGRYLEATARARASLLLAPSLEVARSPVRRILRGEGGAETFETVDPARIEPGMRIEVPLEAVVPVDLRLEGAGEPSVELDLGVLTGEPEPVLLGAGAFVPAGAVPVSGTLRGIVLRPSRTSTLERLAELARSLRDRPSRTQRLADVFASALLPLVWLAALGTFGWWTAHRGAEAGVIAALAVVLAACPCTYAIATPLVHWLALRKALQGGVLVRHPAALEDLSLLRTVAFDKTGTLTSGHPEVVALALAEGGDRAQALGWVAALEAEGRHPVAVALRGFASKEGAEPLPVESPRYHLGLGVEAEDAGGAVLRLGRADWAAEEVLSAASGVQMQVLLGRGGHPLAGFQLRERLRPEAQEAVESLRALGVEGAIVSGDTSPRAAELGDLLGLPVHSGCAPEDKPARVEALGPRVAMVGDGLNDAPALAAASVGIATGGGTALARGVAPVSLLSDDLRAVPWAIDLARRTGRLARRLLAVSTTYNLAVVALAAAGALKPVWAGLSMLASSLLTLGAALSVTRWPLPPGPSLPAPTRPRAGYEEISR